MTDRPELDATFADLYQQVRLVAHRALRTGCAPWGRTPTLGTTGLVHEAFLKLRRSPDLRWQDEGHFLALVSRAMRFVLVDYARARCSEKRGGPESPVPLDEASVMSAPLAEEVLALDGALDRLGKLKPRLARLVECRFIVGLSVEETAQALEVSSMTIKRDWVAARAFLARELRALDEAPATGSVPTDGSQGS